MFVALDHVSGMVVGPFDTFTEIIQFTDSAVACLEDEDTSPFEIMNVDSVEDWMQANVKLEPAEKKEVDA